MQNLPPIQQIYAQAILSFILFLSVFIIKYTLLKDEVKKVPFWSTCFNNLKKIRMKGRASRIEYLNYNMLFSVLTFSSLMLLTVLTGILCPKQFILVLVMIVIILLLFLWLIITLLAVVFRRWHDFNMPIWSYILIFITVNIVWSVGIGKIIPTANSFSNDIIRELLISVPIWLFAYINMCLPGNVGANEFGEPPLNDTDMNVQNPSVTEDRM